MLMSGAAVNSVKRVGFFIYDCGVRIHLIPKWPLCRKKNWRKLDENGVIRAKCRFHTVLHIPW